MHRPGDFVRQPHHCACKSTPELKSKASLPCPPTKLTEVKPKGIGQISHHEGGTVRRRTMVKVEPRIKKKTKITRLWGRLWKTAKPKKKRPIDPIVMTIRTATVVTN